METLKRFRESSVKMRRRVLGDEKQGTHRMEVGQGRSACTHVDGEFHTKQLLTLCVWLGGGGGGVGCTRGKFYRGDTE
jgi:hypothetical protein